jgi:predicted dehydrogenase
MRVGLLGLGDAAKHHARALGALAAAGEITWAAACGRDVEKARAFAPAGVEAFGDLEAMLDRARLEALIVATPDGLHVEHALAALARGVSVLVEKPLALDVEGARRVVEAAESAKRALAVGYHLRRHPAHRLVYAERAALVGELQRIEARWAWPDPAADGWRARGVGARFWSLAALGAHVIDLAMWLADEAPVERVIADVRRRGPVDAAAEVTLRFASGVVAALGVSIEYRATPRLAIVGTKGEIECLATLGARGSGRVTQRTPRGEDAPLPFSPEDPYLAQLRDFVADARAGRTPATGGRAAIARVELLDRIGRAAELT